MADVVSLHVPIEIYERYSSGWCMHLAAALHRKLGWTIQAVICDDIQPGYVEHAWVISPGGEYSLDIDGLTPMNQNGWIRGHGQPYYEELSEAKLQELTLIGSYRSFTQEQWNREVAIAVRDIDVHFTDQDMSAILDQAANTGGSEMATPSTASHDKSGRPYQGYSEPTFD
ncbi:hypothetical protein RBE51_22310 [Pseudomonas taiwanensis]|uniref:hypothetical protein n=1 Tax=Pseudomonas taiwanensis TaxID=470150 RepID=UPI0028DFC771|nr:hypothetical protein [Pseudomonas taiwanensis]MDT8925521.1 hypothetical protein [Pseudomonas taiwanensis]